MKFSIKSGCVFRRTVAPYTGAWIEIICKSVNQCLTLVAPYTGAWIEIRYIRSAGRRARVAPYTGAWIEISL
ncbi:hypothetical protein [Caproicibacterium sp. XB2]|uniref:hypothetical protein n=1 Tax=Caproicibacterium sp. XB2 TaxID=3388458 RepID=UPI00384CB553